MDKIQEAQLMAAVLTDLRVLKNIEFTEHLPNSIVKAAFDKYGSLPLEFIASNQVGRETLGKMFMEFGEEDRTVVYIILLEASANEEFYLNPEAIRWIKNKILNDVHTGKALLVSILANGGEVNRYGKVVYEAIGEYTKDMDKNDAFLDALYTRLSAFASGPDDLAIRTGRVMKHNNIIKHRPDPIWGKINGAVVRDRLKTAGDKPIEGDKLRIEVGAALENMRQASGELDDDLGKYTDKQLGIPENYYSPELNDKQLLNFITNNEGDKEVMGEALFSEVKEFVNQYADKLNIIQSINETRVSDINSALRIKKALNNLYRSTGEEPQI